ncbi:DUF523 and DUF1722 domain-containing protein [Denitrificimonas sp. JX-1]|uniref:DUF523 and DUF1722 domain-containing protein n=1 Tax=Denitrificimonas halotolerans TaxID=3098930 RepID=A0ABU5GXW6_9GAMM|nr:DUF523 and DUF1722 domain-containing protein [Denitrificimonas sp. JX-1]MDY7220483.1 DUF523 and DUF1722 domain-containing protein [Denitrificimonas sp. JX-1]
MNNPKDRIKVGISACLLGAPVRYNGGHKQSYLCKDVLSQYFEYIPICPEEAIGLGTPREPIHLIGNPISPRAVGTVNPELDVTERLTTFGQHTAARLNDLCGYILMQKSPSCGMERVKVYQAPKHPVLHKGVGLFAAALMQAQPNLPVEEEGRLNDPVLRENFITRVFAYAEWRQLLKTGLSRKKLYDFHARYKYQLMANSPSDCAALGRLLANNQRVRLGVLATNYFSYFMSALKKIANRGSHTNVLQHISGYIKQSLSADEKQELQTLITQYRTGAVPLIAPLTLLKHHLKRHPNRYITNQVYLQPHPENLGLRNAI